MGSIRGRLRRIEEQTHESGPQSEPPGGLSEEIRRLDIEIATLEAEGVRVGPDEDLEGLSLDEKIEALEVKVEAEENVTEEGDFV